MAGAVALKAAAAECPRDAVPLRPSSNRIGHRPKQRHLWPLSRSEVLNPTGTATMGSRLPSAALFHGSGEIPTHSFAQRQSILLIPKSLVNRVVRTHTSVKVGISQS